MKRLWILILCFAVVLSSGCNAKTDTKTLTDSLVSISDDSDSTFDKEEFSFAAPTVMITVGEYHASGVIISNNEEEIVIASVAHLLSGYDQGIITFTDMHAGFANVFYCCEEDDICLLSIKKSEMDKEFADALPTAMIDANEYGKLKADDDVYVCGSAVSGVVNITKGTFKEKDYYVPEFDQHMMYLYCDVFEGLSGSGVYNDKGYLVGILSAGSDNSEAVAIPVTDIIDRWENGGINND